MSTSADKLFERAKIQQTGWKRQELDRLYSGFGFIIRNGRSHDIVSHPGYPMLRETLPRHRDVKPVYVRNAVRLINELNNLQKEDHENE